MDTSYNQLSLKERKHIEELLNGGESFRSIARVIDRNPSTISREVKENRRIYHYKGRKQKCSQANWCTKKDICTLCIRPGAYCSGCDAHDCKDICPDYKDQMSCDILNRAPWVCNACRRAHYGCSRQPRYVYEASSAQKLSDERRSEARKGIDMPPEQAETALLYIKDGLRRGLSPYEISVLYEDKVGVHRSTIYRWTEAGYGGLTNLELERKVGFKPRKKRVLKKPSSHSPKRSYEEFSKLPEEVRDSRTEMDCVIGRQVDSKAVLTLYNLPCHVQLALLLDEHTSDCVKRELQTVKCVMPKSMHEKWFRICLTDNGAEFSDEDGLGALLGEEIQDNLLVPHLYYCDPRQSQQKGGCEKNHTEIRQLLEKGKFVFDELSRADMRILMSHVNSNPRASLGGKSPIQMLRFIYGDEEANSLLDAFGICEVGRDELMLKPEILDIERAKRGEAPLRRIS